MISVMALEHRNYIRQTTVSRGNAVVQKSVHHFLRYFHLASSHRHHQMSARNAGSVCSYGTNSRHTIPCTSNLTSVSISLRNKLLCLLQAGRSHVVICNDLWKEAWMSGISSECPCMLSCNSKLFLLINQHTRQKVWHNLSQIQCATEICQHKPKCCPMH